MLYQMNALLLTAALASFPPDQIVTTLNTYAVNGSDPYTWNQQMRKQGPEFNGTSVNAVTLTDLKIEYETIGEPCRLLAPRVILDVRMTLPQRIETGETTKNSWSRWYRFLGSLLQHELQHRDIGLAVAKELQAQVSELRLIRFTDCQAIRSRIDELEGSAYRELQKQHKELDRKTANGQNEENRL